jgi:predicted permease
MSWSNRFRNLFRTNKLDGEIDEEVDFHLESRVRDNMRAGMPAPEARRDAARRFGSRMRSVEGVREANILVWLDTVRQDVRYAFRTLLKNPGFATVAVVSLALGIGANTAIFSLIDAVLLRWLPVHDPQGLTQLIVQRPAAEPLESFSFPLVRALADHREIFASLCGFSGYRFAVRQGDLVESTSGASVSGAYYTTLGLQPAAGRLLMESDDHSGAVPVAVISDGYWQRKFGRSPEAVGRQIVIERTPVAIVGVSRAGFNGANVGETADITLTLSVLPQIRPDREYELDAGARWLRILARLQPGISRERANARLAVIWRSLGDLAIPAGMPADARRRMEQSTLEATPGGTGWTDLRRQFRRPLLVLMAVVGLLLLIACANVANLLLARAAARQREIAVRLAIGASRARIVRQLITEGLLLSLFGALGGVVLAWAGSRVLVNLLSSGQIRGIVLDVEPDWLVLAFTAATACATGILFGLAPAFRGTAAGPAGALRERIAIARSRLAPLLVTAQVSLALLLLIAGGLFMRTLWNLHRVDAGFRGNGVLVANADGGREGHRGAILATFYEGLQQKIERLSGMQSVSYSLITPLAGGGISQDISINGRPVSQEQTHFNWVSRRYFETMGTPLVIGREFTVRDTTSSPRVAIVNRAFARRYLPAGSELVQRLTVGSRQAVEFEIVGVVTDSIYETLREAAPPTVYCPVSQRAGVLTAAFGVVFEAHATGSLAQAAETLRATLQPALPGSPVEVHALNEQVERALVRERLMASLASCFGVLGLVLAAIGLYGLLTYTVARRTNEIGIRLALGAMRREVLWMVIRHVMVLLGMGIAMGIPVAWGASRLVSSMLFGVKGTDPWTIGAATATLTAAGLVAGFLPAWKASRVDPMVALRHE